MPGGRGGAALGSLPGAQVTLWEGETEGVGADCRPSRAIGPPAEPVWEAAGPVSAAVCTPTCSQVHASLGAGVR